MVFWAVAGSSPLLNTFLLRSCILLLSYDFGAPGRITPGFLPSVLRTASLSLAFKIAPGNFVEPDCMITVAGSSPLLNTFLLRSCILLLSYDFGAPGRTRTCYPRLRRPMLYPNELQALTTTSSFLIMPSVAVHIHS